MGEETKVRLVPLDGSGDEIVAVVHWKKSP